MGSCGEGPPGGAVSLSGAARESQWGLRVGDALAKPPAARRRSVEGAHPGHAYRQSRDLRQPAAHLRQDGVPVGRERVARLLRELGLVGLPAKRFRCTTDSDHAQPIAPNVLARDFAAAHPNARWTTDITYLWTREGWLYLAVVLDLFSRRVVGWAVQPHLRAPSDSSSRRSGGRTWRLYQSQGPPFGG